MVEVFSGSEKNMGLYGLGLPELYFAVPIEAGGTGRSSGPDNFQMQALACGHFV